MASGKPNPEGILGYSSKDGPRLTVRQKSVFDKVNLGVPLDRAIIEAGYKKDSLSVMRTRFRKYLDSHPSMIKKSSMVRKYILDKCLQGDAAYIAAAERISARVQEVVDPVRQDFRPQNLTINFTTIDLSELSYDRNDKKVIDMNVAGVSEDE